MKTPTPPQAPQAPPAPPAAPTVSIPPPGPIVANPPTHDAHPALSEAEAKTMADWTRQDLASGKVTPQAAEKIFNDLNTPLEQRVASPDLRTDEQKLMDAHFPIAKPEEFSIRYDLPMTPELKQFDQSARTWLSHAGMPRELGNTFASMVSKVAQTTNTMTPEQLDAYCDKEQAKLEHVFGGKDKLQDELREAALMIHALDQATPGLKNLLKSKGIGDTATIVAMIVQQSKLWRARQWRCHAAPAPSGASRAGDPEAPPERVGLT